MRFYFYFQLTINVDLLFQLEKYLSASIINGRAEKKDKVWFTSHHTED